MLGRQVLIREYVELTVDVAQSTKGCTDTM